MPIPRSQRLALATAFAEAHETPWTRDPLREPQRFGVHHDDPPPWNRLRGPVHARGPCSGVVWQHGVEIAAWGQPERSDQTFSVAKTCLALLAGVAQARGLLPDVDRPVAAQLPDIGFDTPHNAPITWRHLLEQTSEWEGSCFGLPDQVDRWRKVAHDPRPAGGPKGGMRPLQAPGSYWEYNDVRINQLSLALLHLFRLLQAVGSHRSQRGAQVQLQQHRALAQAAQLARGGRPGKRPAHTTRRRALGIHLQVRLARALQAGEPGPGQPVHRAGRAAHVGGAAAGQHGCPWA